MTAAGMGWVFHGLLILAVAWAAYDQHVNGT